MRRSRHRCDVRPATLFQLALVVGLLLAGGLLAATWHTTTDTVVAAEADVPLLDSRAAKNAAIKTTTIVTPTPSSSAPGTARRTPVDVPRNEYAPEPIQEIGTIEIPKIGLSHQIFNGITMRNINLGPSHWPGTALPGELGNAVFAGHRVTKTHPFRNIDQLAPGDQVVFTVAGIRSVYVVIGSKVVLPSAMDIVAPTPTPTATLFACHPPGSARYRYVVLLALQQAAPDVPAEPQSG